MATARTRPAGQLTGEERENLLNVLLDRLGSNGIESLSQHERELVRDLGHMEIAISLPQGGSL